VLPRKTTRVVVAAAIICDRRLLLAQRSYPPELAGQWELPGGKAEDGESAERALIREIAEELGVQIRPGRPLAARVPLEKGWVLVAYTAELLGGQLRANEHAAFRWVRGAELPEVDLVPNDRAWVPELLRMLAS